MRRRISYILMGFFLALATAQANDVQGVEVETSPLQIGVRETPSESFIEANRRSIAVEPRITTFSSPSRAIHRGADIYFGAEGWGYENPFLPGGNGWEVGDETGNVGATYPLGDASYPILISMLILYFLYRGVSSSKRRNNF